jgi:hypothetical protein
MTDDDLATMNAMAFHIARAYLYGCDPDPATVASFGDLSDRFLSADDA